MTSEAYGTVKWYAEQFSDILADVDTDGPYKNSAENILKGFVAALDSWFDYHKDQADAYVSMKQKISSEFLV